MYCFISENVRSQSGVISETKTIENFIIFKHIAENVLNVTLFYINIIMLV